MISGASSAVDIASETGQRGDRPFERGQAPCCGHWMTSDHEGVTKKRVALIHRVGDTMSNLLDRWVPGEVAGDQLPRLDSMLLEVLDDSIAGRRCSRGEPHRHGHPGMPPPLAT